MSEIYRALVAGTGIAGLACALALARHEAPVGLVGPALSLPRRAPDAFDPRVFALSPASQALLERLGVWGLLDARRLCAVEAMEIYGDAQGALTLSAWQNSSQALAWIVESSELLRVLQQAVQVLGIVWHDDTFAACEQAGQLLHVTLKGGRTLTTQLLVGADGARSAVRQAAGIGHQERSYGDLGVVAHLDVQVPHQNRACQWFTGDSVLALLPMPATAQGAQMSLVWSMPQGQADDWLAMDPDARQGYLSAHLGAVTQGRFGEVHLRTPPRGFPLTLERSMMIAPRVALVGDAAHRVHPLAGQGLNLGLGDVQALDEIVRARESYRDAGDWRVLSRYRRVRAEPVQAMSLVTDGLYRLFGSRAAPVAWLRNEGMCVLDRVPFLKRRLIDAAAG